ncbi:hypothetical protein NNA36_06535 [Shimia sp. CNT1-13L.2]|uniref:hypothetical protein n=1 Tax=Shimia sp. CNT1-13L.2 TaxID=2959663 RepID=UPI0020CD681E|nr:hypothetical protein [Shimia sp. CNT1-13L.2]MCP9481617.1 hypothetical protein [Shimia sp. CNT1-13L.2]
MSTPKPIENSIARILIWQTAISGLLAILIIGSATLIPLYAIIYKDNSVQTPPEIKDWGGIIIGFFFGSALTQMSTMITSLTGKAQSSEQNTITNPSDSG